MSKILELREKRAKAWDAAKQFLDAKRGADGMLSEEDTATYDKMEQDVMNLGKEIERLERQAAIDAELSKARVNDFYNQVIWLYRSWTEIVDCRVCDGCSYELTITYKDNRKRKFNGDIGGGTIDETIINFLKSIPEMKQKIEGEDADE